MRDFIVSAWIMASCSFLTLIFRGQFLQKHYYFNILKINVKACFVTVIMNILGDFYIPSNEGSYIPKITGFYI